MPKKGRITERSLYPSIKRIFNEYGATAVQEVIFNSYPDLLVDWLGEKWIISVKIGDPEKPNLLRKAFLQYISHMSDIGTNFGMLIFYPENIRKVRPSEEDIEKAVRFTRAYTIVFKPQMELFETLPLILSEIRKVLQEKLPTTFTIRTVVKLLKEHLEEIMSNINLTGNQIMKIITDPELFFGISNQERKQFEALKFLAAYIFLSQVLFLRFYSSSHPTFIDVDLKKVDRKDAKKLFLKILDINYKPIFKIDTLDSIPEKYIRDTFKLIWGLQVEKIRYELPGRLFHDLMPKKIQKLLAAFYTRPIAAYLLAQITIEDPKSTVFDPACGSGTILTAAYRRKLELWKLKGLNGNPHKIFCEQHIFGADIMPFAVHLTNANLASMDPKTTINKTQIALEDSLKLSPNQFVKPGYKTLLEYLGIDYENNNAKGFSMTGEKTKIILKSVDLVLMNPPFTKVERGIKKYINLDRFKDVVGGEVGLWGHFIALADLFLKEKGIIGAVIPINLLRGRESSKVREIVFKKWVPLYIIKATKNYGFSEWSEYRDILLIAKKTKEKTINHKVKFCLIKKDLNKLTESEARKIAEWIKNTESLRSDLIDINSHTLDEIFNNFSNMMTFISGSSFEDKDAIINIINKAEKVLCRFPSNYFQEAYGPRPQGASKFMFITNPVGPGRLKEAFLILVNKNDDKIIAQTPIGIQKFKFSIKHFYPSLRTPVDLEKMNVSDYDYVAKEPYENINNIISLSGFKARLPKNYWKKVESELKRSKTHVAVIRRINPFSPNQRLTAFFSEKPIFPSCVFHAVKEDNLKKAKAITVLLNSIFFFANFFNLKEESTGRYIDLRQYDLYSMKLYPCNNEQVNKLNEVYERFKDKKFPSITHQFDIHFEERYKQFWAKEREQKITITSQLPFIPDQIRLDFDMCICKALNIKITKDEIIRAYKAIVNDMIITRGLRKD